MESFRKLKVSDIMSHDVFYVKAPGTRADALDIMKENNIRRLPVLGSGKLVGILSDRDVKDASPSKMTAMDIHEFYYFLSEMKVKDAMTSRPLTLHQDDLLERAAILMLKNKISGVPVLDESGNFATRRNIEIGRQNPRVYEVLSGLEPGEKVITSSYDNIEHFDRIVFKN